MIRNFFVRQPVSVDHVGLENLGTVRPEFLPFENFLPARAKPGASPGDKRNAYPVIRKAFRASILPGQQFEYQRRHSPIWQELADLLIGHGVRTYSIYLDPYTNDLFGYVEVTSEEQWAAIRAPTSAAAGGATCGRSCRREDDDSPVTADLREVFHIEAPKRSG